MYFSRASGGRVMSIDSVSGVYVEGVLGGKLVSRDNPLPVNVIGGSM